MAKVMGDLEGLYKVSNGRQSTYGTIRSISRSNVLHLFAADHRSAIAKIKFGGGAVIVIVQHRKL